MLVSVAGSAIIQIPQIARNRIAAEKAILDRAQKQPQHSHGASKQQPPPIVAMQNSARYGKAPRHGQADIDQIGQQKTYGGGQRRGQAIHLLEKTGKNEQPQRKAKLCDGFSLYVRHSPPPNRPFQHGALLAKGRLLGIQFDTLFTDGLYEKLGAPAMAAADHIRAALRECGYTLCFDSPTNQVFCILDNDTMARLAQKVDFGFWEKYDDTHTIVRFATSWATDMDDVKLLKDALRDARK